MSVYYNRLYKKAFRILGGRTPLDPDCGVLCEKSFLPSFGFFSFLLKKKIVFGILSVYSAAQHGELPDAADKLCLQKTQASKNFGIGENEDV